MASFKIEVLSTKTGRHSAIIYTSGKKQMHEEIDNLLLDEKIYKKNNVIYSEKVDRDGDPIACVAVWQFEDQSKCYRELNKQERQDWLNENGSDQ